MDPRPVGMFDSGAGGLSILRDFQRVVPHERVVYFADTASFPYGPRPAAEVRKRAFAIANRLLDADAKLIVVACNTASAAAIADLREAFPVPFVGVVPAVKPAAAASQSKRVVILATPGTFDGDLYANVVSEFGRGAHIASVSGDDLAELVERGEVEGPAVSAALRAALAAEVAAGADTVVLGCTHYEFLADAIRAEYPGVTVLGTSEAVARRAQQMLVDEGLEAPPELEGALDLIVSGDRAAFRETMAKLGFAPKPEVEVAR